MRTAEKGDGGAIQLFWIRPCQAELVFAKNSKSS
jgi:hypothetical protein